MIDRPLRRRAARALFLLFCFIAASSLPAQQRWSELPAIPVPELESAAPPVREVLSRAVEQEQRFRRQIEDPAALANAYLGLGDVYLAHDYREQARRAYLNVLDLTPDRSEVHYRLGIIASADGRAEDAVAQYDRALRNAHPDVLVPGRIRRGNELLELGRVDEALDDFSRAVELAPDTPAAIGGLGRAQLRSGRLEEAARNLRRALEIQPAATSLHHSLAMALRELGRVDAARAALQQAGDGEAGFADPVLASIQMQSRSPQYYLEAGLAQAGQGNYEAAADLLGRADALDPGDPDILAALGEVLVRLGRVDEAVERFERLVAIRPDSADAHLYLGQALQRRGDLSGAESAYREAARLAPGDDRPTAALARLDLHAGRAAGAAEAFAALLAAAEDDDREFYRYWFGMSRLAAGDCAAAQRTLEQGAESGALNPALAQALARIRATCGEAGEQDLAEALAWAEELYYAEPTLESAATLAMVYAARGRFTDAVDLQAQAIFEALKQGRLDARPDLQADMARYREERPAERPFATDHPVFRVD